jgi:hypothetical protein
MGTVSWALRRPLLASAAWLIADRVPAVCGDEPAGRLAGHQGRRWPLLGL